VVKPVEVAGATPSRVPAYSGDDDGGSVLYTYNVWSTKAGKRDKDHRHTSDQARSELLE
jgi:hypothetical protein